MKKFRIGIDMGRKKLLYGMIVIAPSQQEAINKALDTLEEKKLYNLFTTREQIYNKMGNSSEEDFENFLQCNNLYMGSNDRFINLVILEEMM